MGIVVYAFMATATLFSIQHYDFFAFQFLGAIILSALALAAASWIRRRVPARLIRERLAFVGLVAALAVLTGAATGCGSNDEPQKRWAPAAWSTRRSRCRRS